MAVEYLAKEETGHLLLEDGSGALLLETSGVPDAPAPTEAPAGGGNRLLRPTRRRREPQPAQHHQFQLQPAQVRALSHAPRLAVSLSPARAAITATPHTPQTAVSLTIASAAVGITRIQPTQQLLDNELRRLIEDALVLSEA